MCEFLSNYYIPWILGLAFSVVGGHMAIGPTVNVMWRAIGRDPSSSIARPHRWQPGAQGLVERALFTVAIRTDFAVFVAAWLVLKSTSRWSAFVGKLEGGVEKQAVHVNYVLGTGLSIAFAASGAFIITLLEAERPAAAGLVATAVVVGTFSLAWWIRRNAGDGYLEKSRARNPAR